MAAPGDGTARRDGIRRRWTLHGLNNGAIFSATYRGVGMLPRRVSYGIGSAGTWIAWRLMRETRAAIADNLSAVNHGDGVHLDRCDDTAATGNTLEDNNGYGIFLRRSDGTDFAGSAGLQPPPGDNAVSNNRKGDVFVRPD